MVSHQIVYIYYLNFVISGNSSLLTFIANKNPSKNRMQPTPMTSDFGTGCNPPCVGSAYIWSMEIPLTDYSGRCLHIYIYIYLYIYIHVYKSKTSFKYHVPTCLRSLRSLRPWGPLYFCRKSYTSFWIPVLFVGKKSKQRNVCRQDYGFTADDWPLMDHGFKARFEEPAVKGWHRFFPMVNRFGLTGKWFKTCLRKLF